MRSQVWQLDEIAAARREGEHPYHAFLDVPAMSAGLYELAAGSDDAQTPHARDEIYCVIEGRAEFVSESRREPVRQGSVIYVKRGVDHRFERITEDLSVLVLFAGG